MTEKMDGYFLDWIIKGKPHISWDADKFWGESLPEWFYEKNKSPLDVSDENLWDLAKNNNDKHADYFFNRADAITAYEIKEGKYEEEDQDERYNDLVYEHEHEYEYMWEGEIEKPEEKKEDKAEEYEEDETEYDFKSSNAEFRGGKDHY